MERHSNDDGDLLRSRPRAMSDTPRTDAVVNEFPEDADPARQSLLEAALIFHARQLERELALARKRAEIAEMELQNERHAKN